MLITHNPTSIEHYRPISLCNSTYKFISKLIALRLIHHLQRLITTQQVAFVLNRSILYQVLTIHETIHIMNKKQGKFGYILKKLDFSKVYDRLS